MCLILLRTTKRDPTCIIFTIHSSIQYLCLSFKTMSHTYVHTDSHTYMHIINTHIHICMVALVWTHKHAHIYMCIHAYSLYIHASVNIHIRAHTFAPVLAYKYINSTCLLTQNSHGQICIRIYTALYTQHTSPHTDDYAFTGIHTHMYTYTYMYTCT